MYEDQFANRLTQLRIQKGVSARDMSLSIGQNPGYIQNIESGKAFPSMNCFFYICEYLDISPSDFFALDTKNPHKLQDMLADLKQLEDAQLESLSTIIKALAKR